MLDAKTLYPSITLISKQLSNFVKNIKSLIALSRIRSAFLWSQELGSQHWTTLYAIHTATNISTKMSRQNNKFTTTVKNIAVDYLLWSWRMQLCKYGSTSRSRGTSPVSKILSRILSQRRRKNRKTCRLSKKRRRKRGRSRGKEQGKKLWRSKRKLIHISPATLVAISLIICTVRWLR